MESRQYKELKTGVTYHGHKYFCSLELALDLIGGRWKMMALYHLRDGALRSSELQRKMRNISDKMFTQTVRDLEKDGLITRTIYPVVPPKVEYALTNIGLALIPIIMEIGYWGEEISGDAEA